MDVHTPTLMELMGLLVQFPVLAVLLGGFLFGSGFTQMIKRTYIAYRPLGGEPVSQNRFRVSVRWLATLSTYLFTVELWHTFLEHNGAEEVVSIGTAFSSPVIYDCGRALIAWKFPDLRKHLDNEP